MKTKKLCLSSKNCFAVSTDMKSAVWGRTLASTEDLRELILRVAYI